MGKKLTERVAALEARVAELEARLVRLAGMPVDQEELTLADFGSVVQDEFCGPMRCVYFVGASDWMTGGVQNQPSLARYWPEGGGLRDEFLLDRTGFLDAPSPDRIPVGSVRCSFSDGNKAVCFDF